MIERVKQEIVQLEFSRDKFREAEFQVGQLNLKIANVSLPKNSTNKNIILYAPIPGVDPSNLHVTTYKFGRLLSGGTQHIAGWNRYTTKEAVVKVDDVIYKGKMTKLCPLEVWNVWCGTGDYNYRYSEARLDYWREDVPPFPNMFGFFKIKINHRRKLFVEPEPEDDKKKVIHEFMKFHEERSKKRNGFIKIENCYDDWVDVNVGKIE